MIRNALVCLAAAGAVTLTSCGGASTPDATALCKNLTAMISGFATKSAACTAEKDHYTANNVPSGSTCAAFVGTNCTAADQAAMQKWVDCVNGLATCATANESAFVAAIGVCDSQVNSVSGACLK